jgi:plastocyanin
VQQVSLLRPFLALQWVDTLSNQAAQGLPIDLIAPMKNLLRFACLTSLSLLSVSTSAASIAIQASDAAGKPLVDVVIYAEPEPGVAVPKQLKPAEIAQRGLKFMPLVSVIQTGSRVAFPNNDKVRHHIYSFSPAKKFDQKLYSGVAAAPQVFETAGTVVLGCNIHDRMIAYIKVVDTPFFATTDAAGMAHIELPAGGKYTVKAWHYNMLAGTRAEQVLQVKEGVTASPIAFKIALKPQVAEPESTGDSGY